MTELIHEEITLFGICMVLGASLAFVYDVVRILRMLIPHKDIVVDIEDLVFWVFTAWKVFSTLVVYNHGTLRAYAFLGMFLGVVIYAMTLSKLIIFIVGKIVPYWKKCFSILFYPLGIIKGTTRKMLKNVVTEVKIAIKGR